MKKMVLVFVVMMSLWQLPVSAQIDLKTYEQKLENLIQSGRLERGERNTILAARELMRELISYEPQEDLHLQKIISELQKSSLLSLLYYEEMIIHNLEMLQLEQSGFQEFASSQAQLETGRSNIRKKLDIQIRLVDRMLYAYDKLSKNELSDKKYQQTLDFQVDKLLSTRRKLEDAKKLMK